MKYEPMKDHAERKRISALIERCGKEQTMYYVNPNEVLKLFTAYIEEYGHVISKDTAIEELQDALDNAECEWIGADDDNN